MPTDHSGYSLMTMPIMPCYFLAHGSPINAIEDNYFVDDWHNITQNTPRPQAIVVISAHWETFGTKITGQTKPPTLHDFGGFPEALYQIQYPCDGAPALAEEMVQCLQNQGITAALDNRWGLDHGSWSLLHRLYPKADIPVVQLSLDKAASPMQHYQIGQALQGFRKQGILFIGSGNIVHNIRKWFSAKPVDSIAWAKDFDHAVSQAIARNDIATLCDYHSLAYAKDAVPTPEHYLPLLYIMGLRLEHDALQFSNFAFEDLSTACSRSVRLG